VPPEAIAVAEPLASPKQLTAVDEVLTDGFWFTVNEPLLLLEQPAALVPVTEYAVVVTGDTLIAAVVAPVDQR
jgi:hypothetical protein